MANFEEYRQPWETGPHWELKREFMEKYQNDYPLDRLLCLAQVYFNIEILHCSYPEPVTREVFQLSCQLKGCNKFREAEADLERRRKEKAEMQPRKAGKRLSDEIATKPFKFIKFCSEATSKISNLNSDSDKNLCDVMQSDTRTDGSEDSMEKLIAEDCDSNCASKPTEIIKANDIRDIIFSLSHSPDFTLMQKIAPLIPKKTGNPLERFEAAIEASGLENAFKYIFVRESASVICCQFYIGNTFVASGRDTTEKIAKERAVLYGLEILTNLSHLPNKTIEDVSQELENWKKINWNTSLLWSEMSSSDLELKLKILSSQLSDMAKKQEYTDLNLILRFIEKLLILKKTQNKDISKVRVLQEVAEKLKCTSQVHFFHFGEEPNTPLHSRLFHCIFVIKNIFICQTKASSKRGASTNALEQGLQLFKNFVGDWELEQKQNVQDQTHSLEKNCESNVGKIGETHINTFVASSRCHKDGSDGSKSKPKLFRLNHRLLNNSRSRKLVIFDLTETNNQNTAASIIQTSANKCAQVIEYEKDETDVDESSNSQKIFRCTITLNKEEIGKAEALTAKDAKTKAAENALRFLQNNVYTIKVKNEIAESSIISRDYVLNAENPSSVLSESNVGCKMLKMMGWTGGGIGKTSGITEPIAANSHRFGQGLGYNNPKVQHKSLRQRIDALLKAYSQSNTTSDLIFSTEFTKEERKLIHQLGVKYHLLTTSRGKDHERQLFIGKKIAPMDLLEHLIKEGGSTPKYELEDRSVPDRTSHRVETWQPRMFH